MQLSRTSSKNALLITVFVILTAFCLPQMASAASTQPQQSYNPQDALAMLSVMSLSSSDMPADFTSFESGAGDLMDTSHPLNLTLISGLGNCSSKKQENNNDNENACARLTDFSAFYGFAGLVPSAKSFVGNYLYQFASAGDAKNVARTFVDGFEQASVHATFLNSFSLDTEIYSRAISYEEEYGNSTYWHVSAKDDKVILLFVNGIDKKNTEEIFTSSVEKLGHKSSQTIILQKVYLPVIAGSAVSDQIQASEVNGWQTAYRVYGIFYAQGRWHYGAEFSGRNGRSQYYTGPQRTSPGISNWTWYNDFNRNKLLIDSSWFYTNYPASANASYYQAYLDCPC